MALPSQERRSYGGEGGGVVMAEERKECSVKAQSGGGAGGLAAEGTVLCFARHLPWWRERLSIPLRWCHEKSSVASHRRTHNAEARWPFHTAG